MRTLPVRYVWLALLAALPSAQLSGTATATTYQWNDDVTGEPVTCERCPPGTFVRRHCGKDRRTECADCPELHYTEFWNYVERCRYCSVFCGEQQYEKVPCSATHNRVCECKEGYYLNNGFCSRHRVCPAGEGVSHVGTALSNVKCEPCPDGFFSQKPSSTKKCRKHSQCMVGEKAISGTKKHDTFCTLCTNSSLATSSRREDRAVCDKAVRDYVVQQAQAIPSKKLKRLENAAIKMAEYSADGTSLLQLLLAVQKKTSSQPFVNVTVDLLRTARLHHLEDKIRRWFLEEDHVQYYTWVPSQ